MSYMELILFLSILWSTCLASPTTTQRVVDDLSKLDETNLPALPGIYLGQSSGLSAQSDNRDANTICGNGDDRARKIGTNVKNLLSLYNCTVIEGNLEILFMYNHVTADNYTGISLPNLVEITGYLLLYRVHGLQNLGQLFPNLRVIRGRSVFFMFALVLFEMEDIVSLSLGNLTYVGGSVLIMQNPQLCYLNTLDWNRLLPRKMIHSVVRTYGNNEKGCRLVEDCDGTDVAGCQNCWDMDTCQKVCDCPNERGCAPNGECCHEQCLGGCSVPDSASDCYVCKGIFYDGKCVEKCPGSMTLTNGTEVEIFEYEERRCVPYEVCVTDRSSLNKVHNGKCVQECPSGWIDNANITSAPLSDRQAHTCVKCKGTCEKVCPGAMFETVESTSKLEGCTIIDGNLEVAINIKGNMTLLERNLKDIHTVREYVKLRRSHFITSLTFLKNLRRIEGLRLDRDRYALYVMDNENLQGIWDFSTHPNLTVQNGKIFFQQNPRLCYKEIMKLLNTSSFMGKELDRPDTRISAATHTQYDISDQTNGHRGHCFENSLFVNVTVDSANMIIVNFSAFETNEQRIIISYVIFYRTVGENETVSYYSSREVCDDTSALWKTQEIELNQYNMNSKFLQEYIYMDIAGFTRYALYVQTYTTKAVAIDGAQSQIVYFKTHAENPSKPTILAVNRVPSSNRNIGLEVIWKPPSKPKGIIDKYIIYYRPKAMQVDWIDRKDHCALQESRPNLVSERLTTATPVEITSKPNCTCTEQSTTTPPNTVDFLSLDDRESLSLLRYSFENYLQNTVFQKNPLKTGDNSRVRRDIGATSTSSPQTIEYSGSDGASRAVTMDPISTPQNVDESSTKLPTTTKMPDAPVSRVAEVNHTENSVLLFDLLPFTEYSIEMIACHAYDPVTGETKCSKRTLDTGWTAPDPSLDIINSSTFHIIEHKHEEEVLALNFTWQEPEQTNGPILLYKIHFIEAEVGVDQHSDASTVTELCVTAKMFRESNSTYSWWDYKKYLKSGTTYLFKVRMQTVGTSKGQWTEPASLTLLADPVKSQKTLMTYVVSVVMAMVFVFLIFATVCLYKKHKNKRIPLTTLFNSINANYVDTDDVYIPDDWELDRSKIKIGEVLGQGSFGMVYQGTAKCLAKSDATNLEVAIKTTNKTACLRDRIQFLNEASTMKAFNCNHIVKLLGVVSQGQPVLVIMELMAQGDLKNYLRKHRPDEPDNDGRRPPTLREILQMAAEIADGMAYLADIKFVHRDLAARNCMVAGDMTVKIGDFGMTRDIYDTDYYRKGGKGMLPVRWMSPESLRDGVFTSKSDVWSYGVVLWEMATLAAQPYQGFSNEQVLKFVVDGGTMEMPEGCPQKLFDLMSKCWEYFPKHRVTFSQILEKLQGDVKKSFFSSSWYYTSKTETHESDQDSIELDCSDERQPLNFELHDISTNSPPSNRLDSPQSHPDSELLADMMPCHSPGRYFHVKNGKVASEHGMDSDSGADISCQDCGIPLDCTEEILTKPRSSSLSCITEPPLYTTAVTFRPPNWSDRGSNCNGSAASQITYLPVTNAC